jgi:folate-binding protein YgfZ
MSDAGQHHQCDWLADYERVVTSGGVQQLDDWSTLAITGADRTTFLQNMCTNDVRALPVGDCCEAFLTDVKGKIVGHVIVFAREDSLLLLGVPGQAERWIAHLDRYIIREDVQLVDATERFDWRIVIGERSDAQLGELGRVLGPCRQLWTSGAWVAVEGAGERAESQAAAVSPAVWHALRIESGWPLYGVDFDGSHLPQEISRNAQAISFRKGCYLGQETIARIDALGHVNKQLATVEAPEYLLTGDELIAGEQVVGHVTSATYSPRRRAWLGFAMLRRGHNGVGALLGCRNAAGNVVPTPAVAASA